METLNSIPHLDDDCVQVNERLHVGTKLNVVDCIGNMQSRAIWEGYREKHVIYL
jgi:hypothetical protein